MKPATTPRRSRWPLILALAVPPIVFGSILISGVLGSEPVPESLWVGGTGPGPTSSASAAEVQTAHDALHRVGAQCQKANPDLAAIAADVDLIIAFAKRNPVGRFPVDDETATAYSLLLVTREAVADCAPAEAERLESLTNPSDGSATLFP